MYMYICIHAYIPFGILYIYINIFLLINIKNIHYMYINTYLITNIFRNILRGKVCMETVTVMTGKVQFLISVDTD